MDRERDGDSRAGGWLHAPDGRRPDRVHVLSLAQPGHLPTGIQRRSLARTLRRQRQRQHRGSPGSRPRGVASDVLRQRIGVGLIDPVVHHGPIIDHVLLLLCCRRSTPSTSSSSRPPWCSSTPTPPAKARRGALAAGFPLKPPSRSPHRRSTCRPAGAEQHDRARPAWDDRRGL